MNATRNTPRRRRATSKGFTLVEVMVAILIFSFGLLGTAALQARVVQMATQNTDRSQAAVLANEMVAFLWANQSATPDATYKAAWVSRVADPTVSGLPNGVGTVSTVGSTATVKITWKAPSAKTGSQSSTYETKVVIQ